MKRYDLRPLKDNFYDTMLEKLDKEVSLDEVVIFMFEIGDFTPIQKSADLVHELGYTLMNSIKFNEVDWTLVVKKTKIKELQEREEQSIMKINEEVSEEILKKIYNNLKTIKQNKLEQKEEI